MPFEVTYSNDARRITCVGSGAVLGEQMLAVTRAVLVDTRTTILTHCLIDLTAATDMRASNEEMNAIGSAARRIATVAPHVSVALVATRDLAFGLARMWEALVATTGWKTRVFRDRGAACEWLSAESGDPSR